MGPDGSAAYAAGRRASFGYHGGYEAEFRDAVVRAAKDFGQGTAESLADS